MTPKSRPAPKVKAIACPNCGGSVELRGLGTSLHAACINCLSLLDVSHPQVQIVQKFQEALRRQPKIPLGTRGKLHGKSYEVLGFQVRAIYVDGVEYSWDEYVLFNPYHGFRYLSEYQGHWTDIEPLPYLPEHAKGLQSGMRLGGTLYTLFQTAQAKTIFVMGEFPWRVRVGETVTAKDYTAAPASLSEEISGTEVTWSKGQYIAAKELWQAFQLRGDPPEAVGVYFNQPNPYPSVGRLWAISVLFCCVLLGLVFVTWAMSRNERVFAGQFSFTPGQTEPSFVTKPFDLKGSDDNVELEIKTDLSNDWAYFDFALINEQSGTAYNIGKEVSYYTGRDSDGNWAEGDRSESVRMGGVPGGRYYLRVEPEMEKPVSSIFASSKRVNYEVNIVRGKAVLWPYFVMMPFLFIPPFLASLRRWGFETARWAESDPHGAGASSAGEDEEDD